MKKIKMYLGMLIVAALTVTSCQNDTVAETPEEQVDFGTAKRNTTVVQYNYDYYGDRFTVKYTLNNESGEVVSTDGDVEHAMSLFPDGSGPQAVLFTDLPDEDGVADPQAADPAFVEINAEIYNSIEDMEAKVEGYAGEALPQGDGTGELAGRGNSVVFEGPCSSYNISGQGDFYYYKHAYYNTEMTSLRRLDKYYTRNHWVGSSNNDQMSSLIARKPWHKRIYSILYQHSCFNGRAIAFYAHYYWSGIYVRNLSWYRMSGFLWWRTSWNDQVSSTKGWCF